MLENKDWLLFSLMRINVTKRNSKIIWKRLNKLEPKWLKDLVKLRLKEKKRDNNRYNRLWIENSKWKLMTSEEKKPISWSLVAISKEKSS